MTTTAHWKLLAACLDFLQGRTDLGEFREPFIGLSPDDFGALKVKAETVPVQKRLKEYADHTNETTKNLVSAIIAASADMRWNRTYSEAEVGADFLQRYGWFDIIAPKGPFTLDCGRRVMVGVWGEGLDYQAHWHDPAEVYIPISGSATFWAEGTGHRVDGVGDAVFHGPNQKHATHFDQSPFIALILWQAEDLGARLHIQERGSDRIISPAEIK